MALSHYCWCTLIMAYASASLGIGCICLKHGRIRSHTLAYGEQKSFFKHASKFRAYSDVWFIR